jgi:hypothetical protein
VAKVIIEYEAQAASLKGVTDTIINANKQISDSAQTSANLANEVYKSVGKSISAAFASKDVQKSLDANLKSINSSKDSISKLNEESIKYAKAGTSLANGIKNTGIEALKANKEISSLQQTIFTLGKNSNNTGEKAQSLKARLAELKAQISALDAAGQSGSDAFEKLSVEAGQLADQASDTQERIRTLASDTFKFDAAIGAVKGLASVFAVAQGAAALFGAENEDLNKTIARTQASVALLTGLNEIANLVAGQGATKIALQNLFMKEKIVTTTAAAGAVGTLATAEEGAAVATLATKKSLDLLKVAIAGTGIGLLVIALGALYAIYQANAAASKKFNDLMKEQEEANKKVTETLKTQAKEREELNDRLLVAAGKLTQAEADKNKVTRDGAEELKGQLLPEITRKQKLIEQQNELNGKLFDQRQIIRELSGQYNEGAVASTLAAKDQIKALETQKVATLKALAETDTNIKNLKASASETAQSSTNLIDIDTAKENAAKLKDINDKLIQDRLNAELNGLKRLEIVDGESTQNKIDQANKQADIDKAAAKSSIENAKLRASTIALIDAQLAQNVEQIRLDATNKAIEDEVKILEAKRVAGTATIEEEIKIADKTFTIEKNKLQALIDANKASNADLELLTANHEKKVTDIKNKGIQEQYTLRVQSFELQKMLGVTTLEDELSLIRARGESELKANELSNKSLEQKEADRKTIIAKTDADITQAKVVEANKRIDIANAEAQAAVTLGTSTYEQRVKLIEDEGQKSINSLNKKLLSEEEYNAAVLKINADTTAKLNAEQDARIDKAFEYANAVVSVFSGINDLSKQATEQRVADITAASETELQAINDGSGLERDKIKERAALEKRTQAAIAKEKTKQAQNDKALALFQATIQVAQQIAANVANPFLVALIAAAGAIQIAAIASQPIPKFEKGGVVGGKRHSQGGTIIEAEEGEYIVNRKQTSAHRRELNALNQSSEAFKRLINERYVRPALMNYMLGSKSKEMGVNVNATLNSKTMEAELKGLRKDLRQSKTLYNNTIDSRYKWQ